MITAFVWSVIQFLSVVTVLKPMITKLFWNKCSSVWSEHCVKYCMCPHSKLHPF